ncbi:MAG: hypothetical protein E7520_03420 [Ruminococcaceae bacterium]|nr:hypothetical protein [Oscillospiraceae bacterium]
MMKKVFVVLLCVILVCGAFGACAKGNKTDDTKPSTTREITTDDAVIAQEDAINLIKSYSREELGISKDDMKKCSFLVKSAGVKYQNHYYINVIATIKTAHEDTTNAEGEKVTSYTFDNKGEYFIRYDGKEILAKNGTDGKYRKLKVKAVPTTAPKEQEHDKDAETSK